jgi:hypothetical protein
MQLLEKYKEKLTPNKGFARNVEFLLIFSGTVVAFLPRKTLFILTLPTMAQTVVVIVRMYSIKKRGCGRVFFYYRLVL